MDANNTLHANLFLIALLPLIGSVFAYLSAKIAPKYSGPIATLAALFSFIKAYSLFRALPSTENGIFRQELFLWIDVANLQIPFAFHFDALTAVMCLVITGVGTLIHLYSIEYMAHDKSQPRFFAYLNLFLFCMLILVLGANLPVVFIGWEGVGLCSYLLIGFWFTNSEYASAGKKAFIVNRIGDVGFLAAMFLLFINFKTLDIQSINQLVHNSPIVFGSVSAICLAIFIGAIGKSAQIPLFVWLPDAMAGPTPVSALIHAATMVTAGVYLIARLNPLFELAPQIMLLIAVIAVLTAFVAAVIAITQNDIKKVLAYSTVSQLGFMFMAVGVGAYWVAIFHLVTHAFFKACLFLGAGSVIHGCHHEQDMRKMGGLLKPMRITAITYAVSVLAISGIAPFSGYYSKHAILESLSSSHDTIFLPYANIIGFIAAFTGFLTAFYMTRSFALTFLGKYRGNAEPHESHWKITLPLILLAIAALFSGIWLDKVLPEFLAPVLGPTNLHASEGLFVNIIHSWVGIAGVVIATLFYTTWKELPAQISGLLLPITKLSENKFYFDQIYELLIVRPLANFSRFLWASCDQAGIDFTVIMAAKSVDASGFIATRLQTGQLRFYALTMVVSALFLLTFYIVL
jgi:NADH-quinone oxidoreductase subunit L